MDFYSKKSIKIIVTLGPATRTEADLRQIKARGVDFVRINMSHSTLEDLKYFIGLAKKVDIPFIIDTEGSQVRTGELAENSIELAENGEVKIFAYPKIGGPREIALKPAYILPLLEKGDILHVDFESAILRVTDTSTLPRGFVRARAISAGRVGRNKAVVIDSVMPKLLNLPPLSSKDYESIRIGLQEGIGHVGASFMRSADFVEEVRKASRDKMQIISKIECVDALNNLGEIIQASDYLLLDRGDLSKEVPIEKIPFLQKHIINEARTLGKGVFVATNFLESMVANKRPTRAEVSDVINTILDGVYGVVLSSETAIGRYPIRSINMMNKLIAEGEGMVGHQVNGLSDIGQSNLILPHGGKLIDRVLREIPEFDFRNMPKIQIDDETYMDLEQIAQGTFSPLEGFMSKEEVQSVLDHTRLPSGTIWPLPIVLSVPSERADSIEAGQTVVLTDQTSQPVALLHVDDKYQFGLSEFAKKLYETENLEHPGVRRVTNYHPWFLGGKIDLIRRRPSDHKEYELTPRQARRLFAERGWRRIVGFHTRNVIHRSHEFIQLAAMDRASADGLFVHPVVGKKKPGDFHAGYIIRAYETMMEKFYPKDSVVLGTFATYSRYAGPREALFTAICRQNFGCSHFIVGRDHTGVGNFYHPKASHEIFDKFPELEIIPIRFDKVFYSKKLQDHVHEPDDLGHAEDDKLHISGTDARKLFEKGEAPPEWFMRPEISQIILDAINQGEEVFVKDDRPSGCVLWFTGLSGSGKTTVADHLKEKLEVRGYTAKILDGDAVRATLHKNLGFTREDIRKNNETITRLAKQESQKHDFVLVPVISPYAEDRQMAREIMGKNFFLVYADCPLEECIKRDTKGLYRRARAGEIENLIGFSETNPYEAPQDSDVTISAHLENPEQSLKKVWQFLKSRRFV
ncbi:MAG: sulfate adenylyltransferase [Candidatus Doudnabacteria bacterium]|nr:sulfate adenylyltransferase [bacterium]MDZ4244263.1 sulfate adenylyltransferase [Candidatus Doudnabacteria bacterium]